jgi:hypothetical protein
MKVADLVRIIGGRLNEDVPPAALKAVSVDTGVYRSTLSAEGLRHAADGGPTTVAELDASADWAIAAAVRHAGMLGAASGLAGWMSIPPEAAARIVQSTRLAQRLAIIYGHDPQTDRGDAHVRGALAAAWGIALPTQANADIRLSDLPGIIRSKEQRTASGPAMMLSTLSSAAVSTSSKRITRLIPGVGAMLGLFGARRALRKQGDIMKTRLRAHHCRTPKDGVEDAVVVRE